MSAKTAFLDWLAEQAQRGDDVGEYARACTSVRVGDDGMFEPPAGGRELATLEFARVLDARRTTRLYDVAHSHRIGPIALAKLLDLGLPHRRVDGEYLAERDEVAVWLGEHHEPGMCGQWLAVLEGDEPSFSKPE
jgi:hypothetical protein